ncbi:hypothetical protein WAI453_002993 [Rhynchosporium graminicola]
MSQDPWRMIGASCYLLGPLLFPATFGKSESSTMYIWGNTSPDHTVLGKPVGLQKWRTSLSMISTPRRSRQGIQMRPYRKIKQFIRTQRPSQFPWRGGCARATTLSRSTSQRLNTASFPSHRLELASLHTDCVPSLTTTHTFAHSEEEKTTTTKMPPLAPLRASLRTLKPSTKTASTPRITSTRAFSATTTTRAADHAHEDHYDPPSGWLFGVKPGEKPEKEGWENAFVYGFFGSLALGVVGYAFKPDTSSRRDGERGRKTTSRYSGHKLARILFAEKTIKRCSSIRKTSLDIAASGVRSKYMGQVDLILWIQTWALEEARRRLEVEGILKEPEDK